MIWGGAGGNREKESSEALPPRNFFPKGSPLKNKYTSIYIGSEGRREKILFTKIRTTPHFQMINGRPLTPVFA